MTKTIVFTMVMVKPNNGLVLQQLNVWITYFFHYVTSITRNSHAIASIKPSDAAQPQSILE